MTDDLSVERLEVVRDQLDRICWLVAFVERMGRENWTRHELDLVLQTVGILSERALVASGVDDVTERSSRLGPVLSLDQELSELAENLQPEQQPS